MKVLFHFLIFSLFLVASSYSQEKVRLKVYGVCVTPYEEVGKSLRFEIKVDKNKCDPETGYISMEDRVYHLEEALKSKNIDFSELKKSIHSKQEGTVLTERYDFSGSDQEVARLVEVLQNHEMSITTYGNKYKDSKLEDQDAYAICALEDVISKAKLIANHLGYKKYELIGVDDNSSNQSKYSMIDFIDVSNFEKVYMGSSMYSIIGYFDLY